MPEDAPVAESQGKRRDPVVATLSLAVLLMIVVLLASVATVLWYATQRRDGPRTSAERALGVAEIAAKEQPKVVENWAALAMAQAQMGQYDEAEASVARGRKVRDAAILALAYAEIARCRGDLGGALERYDSAKKKAVAEGRAKQKELEEQEITFKPRNDVLIDATIGEARVYGLMGKLKEARAQFDEALRLDPLMADVRAQRGDIEAKQGDAAAARADYEQALRLVPDLEAAKAGLRRLNGGKSE